MLFACYGKRWFMLMAAAGVLAAGADIVAASQVSYTSGTSLAKGLYGRIDAACTTNIAVAGDPAKVREDWKDKDFYFIETDLCPARG
jgi:hypothetical protein